MGCGASTPGSPKAGSPRLTSTGPKTNSYEEWQRKNAEKRLAEVMANDENRTEMETLYKALDVDGDGKLTAEEWSAGCSQQEELMKRLFGDVTQDSLKTLFESLDEDKNGSLSWEEFSNGSKKIKSKMQGAF